MGEKFYCVKCKEKNVTSDVKEVKTYTVKGKKKYALKGKHDKCGTKLTKFCNEATANKYK
ncbi:TPA: hypothetical protein H1005_04395 [archaeon]|uniref:DUF5679 domain-containing protein n=1 Tax=Candidatus Naiadarchaeum limnaeum TaxID=2756139 RepID=A0A832XI92_9ARCH|nr:hypothetical protein [Candidatus Naiadarchaeales archaeon SRR2090153.bin1042]HIK00441.1 hypothetical protein [Candidatus Naiadarchaeum limnaeum]